jgi:hypothetical protein
MVAFYPSSVKTWVPRVNLQDPVLAEDVNTVYEELTAVQTELGLSPKTSGTWGGSGSFSTATTAWTSLKARIQNIENGLYSVHEGYVNKLGGTTVTPSGTTTVNLTVMAQTSQTADLFQAKTSSGSVITKIDSSGLLFVNSVAVATTSGTQTLTNKTISDSNNSITLSPASVIVTGSTDIQEYVDAKPTVYYQSSQPSGAVTGSVWVDSSSALTPFNTSGYLTTSSASVTSGFGFRRITASASAPTSGDGANGDVWLQYI